MPVARFIGGLATLHSWGTGELRVLSAACGIFLRIHKSVQEDAEVLGVRHVQKSRRYALVGWELSVRPRTVRFFV